VTRWRTTWWIGGGNAAFCAALAAREAGLGAHAEKAPEPERGGNSFFTAGGSASAHQGLRTCGATSSPDLSDEEAATITIPAYTEDQYYDDIMRVTEGRSDLDLAQHLVQRSKPTVMWMRTQGIRWILMFSRQSYKVGDRHHFWGGLTLEAVGGGPGLVEALFERAAKVGIGCATGWPGTWILDGSGRSPGWRRAARPARERDSLPRGGHRLGRLRGEPGWRTPPGPNWDLARVRGTRHNVGEGIAMALEIGAQRPTATGRLPRGGVGPQRPRLRRPAVGDMFQKHSYPLGLIVNVKGERS
jgi:tricarballylate dehydrogenase